MKNTIIRMLILLCMLPALSGCGKQEPVQALPRETESVPAEAETTVPAETQPKLTWRDNILQENALDHLGIDRDAIVSVTFLDTLAEAPADSWDLSAACDRRVLAWEYAPGEIYIAGEGGVNGGANNFTFSDCGALRSVTFDGVFHTEGAESLSHLFYNCSSLVSVDAQNLDTSSVRDISALFFGCESLREVNVSGWNTASVTNMEDMFENCCSLQQLDVSQWDTGLVTNMNSLFGSCYSLRQVDVSGWDTASVMDMSGMFRDCISLEKLDVSRWNTGSVRDMSNMFWSCNSLPSVEISIPGANTHNMFYMCYWHDSYFQY